MAQVFEILSENLRTINEIWQRNKTLTWETKGENRQ